VAVIRRENIHEKITCYDEFTRGDHAFSRLREHDIIFFSENRFFNGGLFGCGFFERCRFGGIFGRFFFEGDQQIPHLHRRAIR